MDEVEEVVENLMHNEIDFLDLSFDFAQQAPFTALLYHRRLPDFSDAEFQTLLTVLLEALRVNQSVRRVHFDWSLLRLLSPTEQEVLFRRIGSWSSRLQHVSISGTTANTTHQHIYAFSLLRLLEAGGIEDSDQPTTKTTKSALQHLSMDAMGSLKLQDWTYVEHLSQALVRSAHHLQVLILENVVLPQLPHYPALDSLVQALATTCSGLTQVHVSVSLPRQYRRISQPLVRVETLAQWASSPPPRIIRLHNWGLQVSHACALLRYPNLVTLDVWNNPLQTTTNPEQQDAAHYCREIICESRQQMTLQQLRGIQTDTVLDRFLLLNCCGRATAAHSSWHTFQYWAAINKAHHHHNHTTSSTRETTTTTLLLDTLYTAVREQPSHVPTICRM
eukprot:scaffold8011_cov149-Amphora_coffeaeformis.AAC.5